MLNFSFAAATLPPLNFNVQDSEILTDGLWAISYLSEGENDRLQRVIEAGVVRRISELLMHTMATVLTPALRTIGNIVTGDDLQTQVRVV